MGSSPVPFSASRGLALLSVSSAPASLGGAIWVLLVAVLDKVENKSGCRDANRNTVPLRREGGFKCCGFKCKTNLYHLEGLSQTAEPFLDVLISALPQIKGMKKSVGASGREES